MFRAAVARRAGQVSRQAARRTYSSTPLLPRARSPASAEPSRSTPARRPLWRNISLFVAVPALVLSGYNAYVLYKEHWEHWDHLPPLEERTEYAYQNIRTKNFVWGDGDKTIFWNDKVNYHNKDKVV